MRYALVFLMLFCLNPESYGQYSYFKVGSYSNGYTAPAYYKSYYVAPYKSSYTPSSSYSYSSYSSYKPSSYSSYTPSSSYSSYTPSYTPSSTYTPSSSSSSENTTTTPTTSYNSTYTPSYYSNSGSSSSTGGYIKVLDAIGPDGLYLYESNADAAGVLCKIPAGATLKAMDAQSVTCKYGKRVRVKVISSSGNSDCVGMTGYVFEIGTTFGSTGTTTSSNSSSYTSSGYKSNSSSSYNSTTAVNTIKVIDAMGPNGLYVYESNEDGSKVICKISGGSSLQALGTPQKSTYGERIRVKVISAGSNTDCEGITGYVFVSGTTY